MVHKKDFGKMMRTARKNYGITQNELARIVGVSTVYCREIECGRYTPTWIIWLKICTVLEIDTSYIAETYIKPEINEAGKFLGIEI